VSGLYIRKFIDRVAQCDATNAQDFVWNMQDAKNLHGDITKLLLDIETSSKKIIKQNNLLKLKLTVELGS